MVKETDLTKVTDTIQHNSAIQNHLNGSKKALSKLSKKQVTSEKISFQHIDGCLLTLNQILYIPNF